MLSWHRRSQRSRRHWQRMRKWHAKQDGAIGRRCIIVEITHGDRRRVWRVWCRAGVFSFCCRRVLMISLRVTLFDSSPRCTLRSSALHVSHDSWALSDPHVNSPARCEAIMGSPLSMLAIHNCNTLLHFSSAFEIRILCTYCLLSSLPSTWSVSAFEFRSSWLAGLVSWGEDRAPINWSTGRYSQLCFTPVCMVAGARFSLFV